MQVFLEKSQYALLHNTILKRAKHLDKKLNSIDINIIMQPLGFPENWAKETTGIPQ
ncbi:hypothetical protein [Enterococcus olivae]